MNGKTAIGYKAYKRQQNKTYLAPLLHGVDDYGLNLKMNQNDLRALQAELLINSNSGNKYGASKAGYIAKLNKQHACGMLASAFNDRYVNQKASHHLPIKPHYFGYNILISNQNGTTKLVKDANGKHYMTFVDKHGNNIYSELIRATQRLASTLKAQSNTVKNSLLGVPFSDFGLFSDLEHTIKARDAKTPLLNAHVHMALVIDARANLTAFKDKLNKLLAKFGLYINIEPITVDYPKLEHPAVIDVSKPLKEQSKALQAFNSVIRYNRKQTGYNGYNRAIKDRCGNITELTQEMAISGLNDYARAVASVAIVNTMHGLKTHCNYGMVKQSQADKTHAKAIRASNRVLIEYRVPIENKQASRCKQTSYYSFSIFEWQPPP